VTLGANQIGAYAADLLDLEDQIEALQTSKRDLYKAIRDEHGKSDANSLKLAVKLSRMDGEKLIEAEAVDTEARRMLAIIENGRAPRATRAREIIEQFPARETVASTTAADPAGEADDASSADQSTAALTEVPGTAPDHQDLRDIADAPRSYPPEPQQKAAEHASSGSVAGAPAGTQAPPVDTHSEPEGASIGAKPSMAPEPATEEGTTSPQPSSVVPGRQPGCLNPDTCAGTWRKRCASCERAFMAVAAGGQAIVHQGQVA
jgi:hypothetical protein